MTKMERAIEALKALPDEQRDAIVEIVLDLAEGAAQPGTAMTPEQIAEALHRAETFRPADPERVKRMLARLA